MTNTAIQNPETKPRIFIQVFVMTPAALAKAELPEPKLAEARMMLSKGRENLSIVKVGNGVHSKKYSIMLIDAAITHFEDMIDFFEEGE